MRGDLFISVLLVVSLGYCRCQEAEERAERTRAMALLFSCLQCFPSDRGSNDPALGKLLRTHRTFRPEDHLEEYRVREDALNLIEFVKVRELNETLRNDPFTEDPGHIAEMSVMLRVFYFNADNWPLFYDTATWLLQRVSTGQLFWALMITCLEKFSESVTVPSQVETMPQLFLSEDVILPVGGFPPGRGRGAGNLLDYWLHDPRMNEFHSQWHMTDPSWWNDTLWGLQRERKGEIFLYMHHQLKCRYQAEWWSMGKAGEVEPLGLEDDYRIPEGFSADVLNVGYAEFFSREAGKRLGDFGGGPMAQERLSYARLEEAIEQGFLYGRDGAVLPIRDVANGTDLFGRAASSVGLANSTYYGTFHNALHAILAGVYVPEVYPVQGVESHAETAMRDPVFYQIHARVDELYFKYKSSLQPYSEDELNFKGVSLRSVSIETASDLPRHGWGSSPVNSRWGVYSPRTVLETYFTTETYDISTAVRPCRAVNDVPVTLPVRILTHAPFTYNIVVRSTRAHGAYGMVRVFIWPEFTKNGTIFEREAAHKAAIELDRFQVLLNPGKDTVISRSSRDSSITKRHRAPGLKQLYHVESDSEFVTNPNIRRACAFPNNLLLPRGTKEGMAFKLVVYLSDETEAGYVDPNEDPHYPFCGAVNGRPFPDSRPMGFPFDRPGTTFNLRGGGIMKNVRELKVLIRHQE